MSVDVVLWWHHHQPWYLDPVTGQARLPWVRLHACRGYLDMAAAAAHPSGDRVRHTFNFVPSLLDQLERYSKPGASDLWLDLSRPHPQDMDEAARRTLLHRMGGGGPTPVRPLPELERLRALVASGTSLGVQEMLDLQVLAHLGFCGATLAARPGVVQELMKKGRGFSQAEKLMLLQETLVACEELIQRYKALWAANRIEVTASPYFHPILPLLVDSDVMAQALPHNPKPPRYAYPQDARDQIRLGLARVETVLGKRPVGMWPSEGSVSSETLAIMAAEGVKFCGTDELVLRRSVLAGATADHGHPWLDPSGKVAMFFRDHAVSDLIGFNYRSQSPAQAAHDFVSRTRAFGAHRKHGCMTVILDGENPWEHYPNAGWDHLVALQTQLSKSDSGIRSVTPSQRLEGVHARIQSLHAGSWIDGTFSIWIGHAEDRAAWTLLGDCRAAIARAAASGVDPAKVDAALEKLRPAQGSDWFWWFGEEFSAREADMYDALFREQVKAAWVALGLTPPAPLDVPIKGAKAAPPRSNGSMPLPPTLDGNAPNAAQWQGAVRVLARDGGAMASASGPVEEVLVGATAGDLWVCVVAGAGKKLMGTVKVGVTSSGTEKVAQFDLRSAEGSHNLKGAVGSGATLCWPLAATGVPHGGVAHVWVAITGLDGVEQRVPMQGAVAVAVPEDATTWRGAWA